MLYLKGITSSTVVYRVTKVVVSSIPCFLQSAPEEHWRPHQEEPYCPESLSGPQSIPVALIVPPQMPGQPGLMTHLVSPYTKV